MKDKRTILVVSNNLQNMNLLIGFLEKLGYRARGAAGLQALDAILQETSAISLTLLDLAGFKREIWERCEQLRKNAIPFLVISPKQSYKLQKESLASGAGGMLVKPLVMKELAGFIQAFLGK